MNAPFSSLIDRAKDEVRRLAWVICMRITTLTIPEIGFIAGTRAALGAGVALLLADKLSASSRRVLGITLVTIGAATTIPAAMVLFGRRTDFSAMGDAPGV